MADKKMFSAQIKVAEDIEFVVKSKKLTDWVGTRLARKLKKNAQGGMDHAGKPLQSTPNAGKPYHESGELIKSISKQTRGRGKSKRTVVGVSKKFHSKAKISVAGVLGSVAKRAGVLDPLGMTSSAFRKDAAELTQKWVDEQIAKKTGAIQIKVSKLGKLLGKR